MAHGFVATSPRQLHAMAARGRDEIMDAVHILGTASAPMIAHFLGRSRNGLYYHLRALRDCGLIVETFRSGEGKKRTAYYELPSSPFSVRFDFSTPQRARAVLALMNARFRGAARGFRRACKEPRVVDGPRRDLWATRWQGWLSPAELEEMNRLFWRIIELLRSQPGDQRAARSCYEFTFAFCPVVPRPTPLRR